MPHSSNRNWLHKDSSRMIAEKNINRIAMILSFTIIIAMYNRILWSVKALFKGHYTIIHLMFVIDKDYRIYFNLINTTSLDSLISELGVTLRRFFVSGKNTSAVNTNRNIKIINVYSNICTYIIYSKIYHYALNRYLKFINRWLHRRYCSK